MSQENNNNIFPRKNNNRAQKPQGNNDINAEAGTANAPVSGDGSQTAPAQVQQKNRSRRGPRRKSNNEPKKDVIASALEKLPERTVQPPQNQTKQTHNQNKPVQNAAVQPQDGKRHRTHRTDAQGTQREVKEVRKTPVKIIPLGGLGEIGKNMTVYECNNDMFIVDCGLAFPDEEMLGVDIVIPDFTYVEKNLDKLRGVVITHGHEDHIGGLPYFLKRFNVPVYGTRLTLGLVEGKLKEHNLLGKRTLNVVKPRDTVKFGCMAVEFIRVNHSIPDAVAFAIHTPAGVIIQTGDFKVDYTPIEGGIIDLARFGELGSKGVLALLSDSTNAERPGSAMSEKKVGESFELLFAKAGSRRVIIASFASNIHRIQQIIDMAVRCGRKVAVSGRSMINVVAKAVELGYLSVPEGVLIDMEIINRYPDEELVIITTGSQGEPMSALSRMASGDHRNVSINPNDFIIISATPIPGNEKLVSRVVNDLMKLGAEVIYEKMYEAHVSGHACQDELRLMLGLTKPKFFMPVHGEYKHLKKHAGIAISMGLNPVNVIIGDIGKVIETDSVEMKITGTVPAGRVLVDGLGVGDVGSIVLRDRKHLAEDGLIVVVLSMEKQTGKVVAGPDIVSRGFVYVRESEELIDEARNVVKNVLAQCGDKDIREWGQIKTKVKDALSDYVYRTTKRSPMILPIIMEV
ncbi:ribonuclease J [Acetanaerobacterium elongatum]|uniref:Ribonuclease J n=1 Tax=Acetanaerobacterium elongatum TaxID=258515 RepID=A0A1H0BQI4_9FIRM|nr:ribonuclease J [Acetanaerobacterium elongatum]SDN47886.1 ribonuclease J [Acetanaerobacterium elongatum]